jgi:membrane-associated phospholipid phosphatase
VTALNAGGAQRLATLAAPLAASLGACLIILSILFLDRPIAELSHAVLHRPAWCIWLTWIADVPAPAGVAVLAATGLAYLCGWRPGFWGRLFIAAAIATLTAVAAKDVLKYAFGRPWPETWVNNNPSWIGTATYGFFPFHGGPGFASFPSGHTTAITAPCAVAWRQTPRARPLCLALPCLVVLGLLGCDYHFLSDCIAGAMLGAACGTATDALIEPAR